MTKNRKYVMDHVKDCSEEKLVEIIDILTTTKKEQVNHPSHYNQAGKKECIVAMEEEFGWEAVFDFCVCNAFKYEYRAGEKDGNSKDQDLQKAEWYKKYAEKIVGSRGGNNTRNKRLKGV